MRSIRLSTTFAFGVLLSACGVREAAPDVDAATADSGPRDASGTDGATPVDAAADANDDAGADWPPLPECIYDRFGTLVPQEHDHWRGSAAGASWELWVCLEGQGSGHSGLYRADRFALSYGGNAYRATTEALDYTNSHHNWNDRVEGRLTDRVLRWETAYDVEEGVMDFVEVLDLDGGVLLPRTRADRVDD